ncbi:MAPEG family protein [Mesorhizobium marinum]|uniref:MAPEG family protein n=1 Tax=Mesorhizobium marinum TaxID=3228790 RepID=A0ABV3QVN6_9HYPH
MNVTPIYAGLLGLLLTILSVRVIAGRRTFGISLGTGANLELERRMRAQGNLAEYAPIGLLLLAMLEVNGGHAITLHSLGSLLLLGRLMHAWALSFERRSPFYRTAGMALTLTSIGMASLFNLVVP